MEGSDRRFWRDIPLLEAAHEVCRTIEEKHREREELGLTGKDREYAIDIRRIVEHSVRSEHRLDTVLMFHFVAQGAEVFMDARIDPVRQEVEGIRLRAEGSGDTLEVSVSADSPTHESLSWFAEHWVTFISRDHNQYRSST